MTTVAAGATGTYTFTATQTISVSLDPNERARVTITRSGAIVYSDTLSASRTIGPFLAADIMSITAMGAAIDYTVNSYQAGITGSAGVYIGVRSGQPAASASNIGLISIITDENGGTPEASNGVSHVAAGAPVTTGTGISGSLWANRGSGTNVGDILRITDFAGVTGGNPNVLAVWDGTYWQPLGGEQDLWSLRASVAGSAAASSSPADQTITIPGNLLNIYGALRIEACNTTANVQTATFLPKCNFGGSTTFDGSTSMGTKKLFRFRRNFRNTGATNAQIVMESANADDGLAGTSSNQAQVLAIDTSANFDVVVGSTATHATSITNTLSGLKVVWRR